MAYKPPYTLSSEMLASVSTVNRLMGRIEGYQLLTKDLRLRRINKIRSLHSSLLIEGNQLNREQVTAILNGDRVIGPPKDIKEVENAILAYDRLESIDPYSEDALLQIHGLLMQGLVDDAGKYRSSGVGVVDGEVVIHIAPPPLRVPHLMGQLFEYLTDYPEDIVIKSCVFHYEFEFIHPFSDGNGRMGRLWQTALLKTTFPDFVAVPLESIIHDRQQDYYAALLASQRLATSNPFILFALDALIAALEEQLENVTGIPQTYSARLLAWQRQIVSKPFSRKQYQLFHKDISAATATRDLTKAVQEGSLQKTGRLATTRYCFV